MEVFQQESVIDNSKNNYNDCLLNNVDDANKTSENLPSFMLSDNKSENLNTDTKEKNFYIVKNCELTVHNDIIVSSSIDIKDNSSYTDNTTIDNLKHILLTSDKTGNSTNYSSDMKEVILSYDETCQQIDSNPRMIESLNKFENDQNHTFNQQKLNENIIQLPKNISDVSGCPEPNESKTVIMNASMGPIQKEISMIKSLDKVENNQMVFSESELNGNSIQVSKDVNLEKDHMQPTELKTGMVLDKENLSSYRYEYDSWSEDDESSSTSSDSSDTSSGSDFFQRVVESSSGPKNNPEIKTRGELGLDDLPPIEELSIQVPKEDMVVIGNIHAVVEKLVVVHAVKDMKPLDIDSVLFLAHDKPLGRIYDVFGPVVEPFYCIRFNTVEEINEKIIEIGANVFFAPEKNDITSYVFVDELQKEKGSDASWEHNNEPPEECLDFSDDEQEKEARRRRINKYRNRQFSSSLDVPAKRPPVITLTNTFDSQQNFRSRPTTPLFTNSRNSINVPSAARFSPFSSSQPFYPPQSPSPIMIGAQNHVPFPRYPSLPPASPSPSVIEVQTFTPFSNSYPSQPPPTSVEATQAFTPFSNGYPSRPPSNSLIETQRFSPFPNANPSHSPSPSVIEVQTFTPFSNGYPSQPPPSPSTSVASAQRFSPFPNASPSHSPSPSVLPVQRYIRFSGPPPSLPPTAPRFTPFSNSYPLPPCSSAPARFAPSSNSYPPPAPSPVFLPSRMNRFTNQCQARPPPTPSFAPPPTFNQFSNPNSAHTHPLPSLSFSHSNSGAFAESNLPFFTSWGALQSHSSSNLQPHSNNHATLFQQGAAPINSHQQNSYSAQTAMQGQTRHPQHVFGQVTPISSLPPPPPPPSIPPPVDPWNESPRPLMQVVRPPTNCTYAPL